MREVTVWTTEIPFLMGARFEVVEVAMMLLLSEMGRRVV
jgi:hypothetical protein